jgi:hypothetical protein
LYCDLAEAYLLRKDFSKAQGYARHATLTKEGQNEQAYYLMAESLLLDPDCEVARERAMHYIKEFKDKGGTVSLEPFQAICKQLDDARNQAAVA